MNHRTMRALTAAVLLSVTILLPFSGAGTQSVRAADTHITAINGSFIQPWLYASWDAARWEAEMQVLKDVGIEYLIMGDVANHNTDGSWTVYYPSELESLKDGYVYNAVDSLLSYCQAYDIKVYLGMGLDCAWDSDITTESGRAANRAYMTTCNQITTELYQRYKVQYPDTYYGFYFVTELYNTVYMDWDEGLQLYVDGLDEMFTMVLENCNALDPTMPLLFSPYVNIFGYGFASVNLDRFTEFWTAVLSAIPFRDGDMLCPQDSCGGGGNRTAYLGAWTAAYRNAVDRANAQRGTHLLLGTNAELFVSPDAERMSSPHGVSYVGTKTVQAFTDQLEIARPYVDALFCFAYSHHYSPYNAIPAFHAALLTYLHDGTIEREPPTPPTVIRTETVLAEGEMRLQLSFSGMDDNTAIAQTNLYKNGKLCDYLVAGVNNGQVGMNQAQTVWIDYAFDTTKDTAVYELECVDVCGMVSEKCSYTVSPANVNNGADLTQAAPNCAAAVNWGFSDVDWLTYQVTENGVRITGCDRNVTQLVIPDTIAGVPVTVIDWYAFERCEQLRCITLPDSITHISRFAFAHCIALETINWPASLAVIEQYAFYDCPKLRDATLPERLRTVEERAFSGCASLTEVWLPAACETVGDYAFFGCDALREIHADNSTAVFGTRSLGYGYQGGYALSKMVIMDATTGTAKTYAEEQGILLRSNWLAGDINGDGVCGVADAVLLSRWLCAQTDVLLAIPRNGDLNQDGALTVTDLTLLKRTMLSA